MLAYSMWCSLKHKIVSMTGRALSTIELYIIYLNKLVKQIILENVNSCLLGLM